MPLIISLEGDYDLSRRDELGEQLAPAVDAPDVVIDFTQVAYADSTCLNKLINMRNRREEKHFNPATLVIPNPWMRKVFVVTGLADVWPIVSTLEEALGEGKEQKSNVSG